jgi:hypothetical protein
MIQWKSENLPGNCHFFSCVEPIHIMLHYRPSVMGSFPLWTATVHGETIDTNKPMSELEAKRWALRHAYDVLQNIRLELEKEF